MGDSVVVGVSKVGVGGSVVVCECGCCGRERERERERERVGRKREMSDFLYYLFL